MLRSSTYLAVLTMTLSLLAMVSPVHAADPFGNGTIKTPTTASGGTGTAANLQTDDDVNYTVAKGATASIGGFGTHGGAITSVYLFVQYTVENGYTGTNTIKINGVNTTIVPAVRDYGRWAYVDITAGSFGIDTSAEISTLSVGFTNNDAGTSNAVLFDCAYVVVNPQTAIPAPPTWSEDFNGTGQANPMVWNYEVGYQRNNEVQYYVAGASNGWQESGNFIIEGRKEAINGYQYTSASIVTNNKYYWKFGRAQIRAKIPAKAGMWPAIWGTGEVGQWPHNGEVDIMEYYGEKILGNVAVGQLSQWSNAKWDSSNRAMASLLAVDSNWRNEWHIWTMQWDDLNVRIYVDNILVNEIPQSWMKNTDGYNTAWGPQYPFQSNGMSCWLNLAMGGNSGGDPTATMNSGPQRYLIDYWKVWEGATNNVAPTDIALTGNGVTEGLPVGTVVGTLSATDADPAEVFRYTLVAGTGDTHNAQFSIPAFISGNTLQGVLKTAVVLNIADGATRSIRVRVTDIEGVTYEKVLVINVNPVPAIETSINPLAVNEGGTNSFHVRLNTAPAANVTVNVARTSGDTDISVASGSVLTFTPQNATQWQQVALAAVEDADRANGTATIVCSDAGAAYGNLTVTASESDNDNTLPTVNAGPNQNVSMINQVSWTPASMATAAWYDASTLTQGSGAVSQWNDKSGNNYHAIQTTPANQPEIGIQTLNGLPLLTARNGAKFMSIATGPSARMGIALVNLRSTTTSTILNIGSNSASSHEFFVRNTAPQVSFDGTGATTGIYNIDGGGFSGAAEDHTQVSTGAHVWAGVFDSSNTLTTIINRSNLSSDATGHDVGEIIWFQNELSLDDRQKIEGYLAHKWGLTVNLPANHPYKALLPTVSVATANLNATASDADQDSLTTTWSWVSGPAAVSFANSAARTTTATFSTPGTYTLRLTANDSFSEVFDDVVITVNSVSTGHLVTFDKQSGSGGSVSVSPTTGSAMPTAIAPSRSGYIFGGYYTEVSGGGTQYYDRSMTSVRNWDIASNTTLDAYWTLSYQSWSSGASATTDSNNDGIANGIAWVLGAANSSINATHLLPTCDNTTDASYFIYSYRRSDAANNDPGTTIVVEYGSDLSGWTSALHDNDNVIITSFNDSYGAGVDRVDVKIKRTLTLSGKLFSRLKLVAAP